MDALDPRLRGPTAEGENAMAMLQATAANHVAANARLIIQSISYVNLFCSLSCVHWASLTCSASLACEESEVLDLTQ